MVEKKEEQELGYLQEKYRPNSFKEFVGNEGIVSSLLKFGKRKKKDIPHALLFTGQKGCGKTTLAYLFAKEVLGCSDKDFHEYDSAQVRGIDTIRDIKSMLSYSAFEGDVVVYLLDECHMVTDVAANGLLKMLEKPPVDTFFILCTTEPRKLLGTIRSRCTTYEVTPLDEEQIYGLLKRVHKAEGISFSGRAARILRMVTEESDGVPREALKLFDQVRDIGDPEEARKIIQSTKLMEEQVKGLCQALLKKAGWRSISGGLKEVKSEPEQIRYAVLGYMSAVLLNNPTGRVSDIITVFEDSWMYKGKAGMVNAFYIASKI